jgi:hypothetical protein
MNVPAGNGDTCKAIVPSLATTINGPDRVDGPDRVIVGAGLTTITGDQVIRGISRNTLA